jgi:CheY-like chemotaxis protein
METYKRSPAPSSDFNYSDLRRIRTLVVDDSSIAQRLICSFLSDQQNIEIVGTALDGRQALDKVQALQPQLVLVDVQMPVMNGLEFTRELRKRFPATRIIAISIEDEQGMRLSCEASGADAFVSKIRLPELPQQIRRLFRS